MTHRSDRLLNRLYSLAGKTAIVTGGSRGIGAMIARGFVESGVKTYIIARNADDCDAAAREMSEAGECISLPANLATVEGIGGFADAFGAREAKLDILVNNAGTTWGAPFEAYPEKGWDKVFDLNLKSLFFLTQKLHPLLRAAGSANDPARVINISSINGLTHPHMNNYAYSASKAGVAHLTKHLAADLAASHINVNALAPGYFPSKMTAHFTDDMTRSIPLGRVGRPDDAAGAAIFLASPASAWITGAVLPLDGGMVAAA
ncbi:MAG: SDR family oxidoreductase [Rubrivivax sp.]